MDTLRAEPPTTNLRRRHLHWDGDKLRAEGQRTTVCIVRDGKYPQMWRVALPDGTLTDMYNRTWARDHAKTILLGLLE